MKKQTNQLLSKAVHHVLKWGVIVFPAHCCYCEKKLGYRDYGEVCLKCVLLLRKQQKEEADLIRCEGCFLPQNPLAKLFSAKVQFLQKEKCADCMLVKKFHQLMFSEVRKKIFSKKKRQAPIRFSFFSKKINEKPIKKFKNVLTDWPLCGVSTLFDSRKMGKRFVYDYKFNGRLCFATIFARLALHQHSNFFSGLHYIVPVPANPLVMRERGYCPVQLFAEHLSKLINVPLKQPLRRRSILLPSQKYRTREERWNGIAQKYNCKPLYKVFKNEKLEGSRVLLIDDVMTSGATLHGIAALMLQQNSRLKISAFCLLRTLSA